MTPSKREYQESDQNTFTFIIIKYIYFTNVQMRTRALLFKYQSDFKSNSSEFFIVTSDNKYAMIFKKGSTEVYS